jgi:hypothetical protein
MRPPEKCHVGGAQCDDSIEGQKQTIIDVTGDNVMKYLLLMYANEAEAAAHTPPEKYQDAAQIWASMLKEMNAAGVLLSTGGVAPTSNATTVRVRNGKTLTTDGPFAETHEQLGGYFLVECQDLDEAVRWAAKIPTANFGSIEVRPLWQPG